MAFMPDAMDLTSEGVERRLRMFGDEAFETIQERSKRYGMPRLLEGVDWEIKQPDTTYRPGLAAKLTGDEQAPPVEPPPFEDDVDLSTLDLEKLRELAGE